MGVRIFELSFQSNTSGRKHMSKPIRLSQERAMTDMELLTSLHLSALKYNQYADKKLLYIYRANTQNAPYENYEVFFGRENFIHLVGFKRAKINAIEFFDKCCSGTLQLHEVSFKESLVHLYPFLLPF